MRDWLVAADDRTGAFEVAALFAACTGPVTVTVGEPVSGPCVVDLGSRQMAPALARRCAGSVDDSPSGWVAHKIDSTLRGNWAVELVARREATRRRLLVLPAWPALGRTCVGGVVHVHGSPIGSPLDHLPAAELLAGAADLRAWLSGDGAIAVCDVPDTASMAATAALAAAAGVLLAGPAGPLGAAFAARFAAHFGGSPAVAARPLLAGPVLVVCGSASPVSRKQIARLAAVRPDIEVVAAPETDGPLLAVVAQQLARAARSVAAQLHPSTVVIIGGDTAAAFLGDSPRLVGGSAATGMPWSRDADGAGPVVVTKAGGFGGPDALVDLLCGETG